MKALSGVALLVGAILAIATTANAGVAAGTPVHDDNAADVLEIRQYRLTMDKIEKAANATQQVNALLASNPDLKKRAESGESDNDTIDQKARRFDTQFPEAAAIIHRNGLTSREYIVISLAMLNDIMVVGMKMQGAIKTYPPNTVTPENAAFVEQNYEKLKALAEKMTPPEN
jgi:hypothetical protein